MKIKTNPPMPVSQPSSEDTSRRAYELWQNSGSPDGRSEEFWLEAERQLSDSRSSTDAVKRSLTPPARGGFSSAASRDIDTLGRKTDELLRNTGEVDNRSPTALNLDRS